MEPTMEICAGGVVIKDGKVVAIKRKNGVWLMPKGHVDPGETLEEAASARYGRTDWWPGPG